MPVIASVFDSEVYLDDALRALYSQDIEGSKVVIMRDAGMHGDGTVNRADRVSVPVPPIAVTEPDTGAVGNAPAIALATGVVDDLHLDDEVMSYYRSTADGGGTVVFVEVDSDRADEIVTLMKRRGRAVRVDRLD